MKGRKGYLYAFLKLFGGLLFWLLPPDKILDHFPGDNQPDHRRDKGIAPGDLPAHRTAAPGAGRAGKHILSLKMFNQNILLYFSFEHGIVEL